MAVLVTAATTAVAIGCSDSGLAESINKVAGLPLAEFVHANFSPEQFLDSSFQLESCQALTFAEIEQVLDLLVRCAVCATGVIAFAIAIGRRSMTIAGRDGPG